MALFNVANLSTLNAVTSSYNSVPTTGAIIINSVPTAHLYRLDTVIAVNKTSSVATVTLVLYRNSSTYTTLAYQIGVPGNASIALVSKDAPIYLMDTQSDTLSAQAGTANAIDILVSYDDIS